MRRAGRVSLLVPLGILGVLTLLGLRGLEEQARTEGYGWIDPAVLDLGGLPDWADPRWERELDALLLDFPPFSSEDVARQEDLRAEIEALSFVAAAEITEILWPDGLALELDLHEPVACVPVGHHFLTVAADGTLLTGRWSAPPLLGDAPLPVVGPIEDRWGLFELALPGDYLVEPEHLDAVDVALSLRDHLPEAVRAHLGRVVIDARRARDTSVTEPGTRLLLEDERLVLFGRAPSSEEPGELPAAAKWRSLAEALVLAATPDGVDRSWHLVDVRWDVPEIVLRHPPVAMVEEAPRPARGAPAPRPRRDPQPTPPRDGRARVR